MSQEIKITERPHLLMAYGTLKRDMGNDFILERTGCLYGGDCLTRDLYILADGGFPRLAVIPPGNRTRLKDFIGHVRGELWHLTDEGLAACDKLEGHPRFYKRTLVEVLRLDQVLAKGEKPSYIKAWLYIINTFPVSAPFIKTDDEGTLTWHGEALKRHLADQEDYA